MQSGGFIFAAKHKTVRNWWCSSSWLWFAQC